LKGEQQYEALLSDASADADGQGELATTLSSIAQDFSTIGDHRRAIDYSRRASAILSNLTEAHPGLEYHRQNVASNQNNLGSALWFVKDYRGSAEVHRQGIAALTALLNANPRNLAGRDGLAACQTNLGNALWSSGDLDAAADAYRQAVATGKELVNASPDAPEYQRTLGRAFNNLGALFQAMNRFKEAEQAFRQAIEHERIAFDRTPTLIEYRRLLSESCAGLSRSLRSLGRADEAAQIVRTRAALWKNNSDELYNVARDLAVCMLNVQGTEQAQALAAEAVQTLSDAAAAGWNDAQHTSRDPDLARLRDRDDFRRLLVKMFDRGFPADPFAH
jgi:tetratricopeptide (TPR) repeat protein